jgi:hypothetical protein
MLRTIGRSEMRHLEIFGMKDVSFSGDKWENIWCDAITFSRNGREKYEK